MSTPTEYQRVAAELAALRAQLSIMADAEIAAHEKHLHVTRRSAPNHRPCESASRAKFAERLLRLLESEARA